MDIPAPADGWLLPDEACDLLVQLVEDHRPDLIVECGSGRSTVVLAEALREIGKGRVVALEHHWDYWHETFLMLEERELFAHAQVRQSHLAEGWYARETWDDLYEIGMLVVDGPPRKTGWEARAPALTLLRDRLLPGAPIILDDIDRDDLYGPEIAGLRERMTIVGEERPRIGWWLFDGDEDAKVDLWCSQCGAVGSIEAVRLDEMTGDGQTGGVWRCNRCLAQYGIWIDAGTLDLGLPE